MVVRTDREIVYRMIAGGQSSYFGRIAWPGGAIRRVAVAKSARDHLDFASPSNYHRVSRASSIDPPVGVQRHKGSRLDSMAKCNEAGQLQAGYNPPMPLHLGFEYSSFVFIAVGLGRRVEYGNTTGGDCWSTQRGEVQHF